MPSLSFADVLLEENPPPVSRPTVDRVGAADTKRGNVIPQSRLSSRDACFSIEDRSGSSGLDDKRALILPLTTVCVGLLSAADETGWSGHEARGDHARSVGNWSEAEKAYAKAVELLDRTTDKEVNQNLAALLNKLGVMRLKRHDFVAAETVFKRALTIYTATQEAEDLRVGDTLDLVASALLEQPQGRSLAGPLFYRAWVIREGNLIPDHPAIADSLHHVAVSLYSADLSRAIPLFLRSREIREKAFGHDHPLVAKSLNAMARLYEMHNRRDLAIPLYQEALTIQEKVFGPNASETIQARDNLDMAHQGTDNRHEDPNSR